MSYLLNNRFTRIIEGGLTGVSETVLNATPTGPSRYIQDYMHLPEFIEVLNKTKSLQEVENISPINLIGFTTENQENILTALVHGLPLKECLDLAGIKSSNYEMWEKMAERDIEPFKTFIIECKKAQALVDAELIQQMRRGGWKGAIELYKLRHPELDTEALRKNQQNAPVNVNVLNILERKPEDRQKYFEDVLNSIDISEIAQYEIIDPE